MLPVLIVLMALFPFTVVVNTSLKPEDFLEACHRIYSITSGYDIGALTLDGPPHSSHQNSTRTYPHPPVGFSSLNGALGFGFQYSASVVLAALGGFIAMRIYNFLKNRYLKQRTTLPIESTLLSRTNTVTCNTSTLSPRHKDNNGSNLLQQSDFTSLRACMHIPGCDTLASQQSRTPMLELRPHKDLAENSTSRLLQQTVTNLDLTKFARSLKVLESKVARMNMDLVDSQAVSSADAVSMPPLDLVPVFPFGGFLPFYKTRSTTTWNYEFGGLSPVLSLALATLILDTYCKISPSPPTAIPTHTLSERRGIKPLRNGR